MCGACNGSGGSACTERQWLLPTLATHALEHTSGHVQRHGDEAAALPSMRHTDRAPHARLLSSWQRHSLNHNGHLVRELPGCHRPWHVGVNRRSTSLAPQASAMRSGGVIPGCFPCEVGLGIQHSRR